MHVKTILNRIHRHRSFVYEKVRFLEEGGELALEAEIRPRVNGRTEVLGMQRTAPRLRHAEAAPIRVHSDLGHGGVLRVRDAAGRLRGLWHRR
jgi:hypothetical protein